MHPKRGGGGPPYARARILGPSGLDEGLMKRGSFDRRPQNIGSNEPYLLSKPRGEGMSISIRNVTLISACAALVACGPEPNEAAGTWVAIPSPPTTIIVNTNLNADAPAQPAVGSDVVLRNVGSDRCLDVPRQAEQSRTLLWTWRCNGTAAQKWTLTRVGQNGYRLTSRASGKCLDVPHATRAQNITLWQFDCNGTPAQGWNLEPAADGTYLLRSRVSDMCLDVPHGQAEDGVGVQQYPCHGGAPQRWIVTRA
jgi:hypothetical protein